MLRKKNILTAIIFSVAALLAQAQTNSAHIQPEVGKPMPEFTLSNVTHYKTQKVSLNDFKGKWLFLDFWFTGCVTCIKSFPKVNEFHKEFKDKAVYMLVGKNDKKYNRGIQELYEKFVKKQGLEMPAAYDSLLTKQWGIWSMPHIIIVDPQGIVRSITGGRDMTKEKIRDLIAGKNVSFYPKDAADRIEFDTEKLTDLENAKNDDKLLFRSLLTKWNGENQNAGIEIPSYVKFPKEEWKSGYNVAMVPLSALYSIAYFGQWGWGSNDPLYGAAWQYPIFELQDSSLFDYDFKFNVGKGTYNYNLTIPYSEVTEQNIMRIIQEDLKRYFKYEPSIEKRNMPVWNLIAKPNALAKLKTKGGDKYFSDKSSSGGAGGFTARNIPVARLLNSIKRYLGEGSNAPFLDETGITYNIDITIDALMTDKEDVRKALQKAGLDLVLGTKEMKVLVIRDAAPDTSSK